MKLYDSHCHLQLEQFDGEREETYSRARDEGVERMNIIGIDATTSHRAVEFAKDHEGCYPTAGLHPHEADLIYEQSEPLKQLIQDPAVVAVGETGLDYFKEYSPKTQQEESLVTHINWALDYEKPLVFHCRDADDDLIEILKSNQKDLDEVFPNGGAGVIHCFSGNSGHLKTYQELGFYVSFSGIVTYPNAEDLQETAREADTDWMLVETDSPFLAPQAHRGKQNEPAYVKDTLQFLADLKEMEPEQLAEITTRNARELFNVNGM